MSKLAKALTAAAGNAGESLYVEDVFSTYLYTGNNSSQTITNNIDLAGEGGLVWFKRRSTARTHILIDTERGKTSYLQSNETVAAETGITNTITSFNSDGFSISDQQDINGNAETVASFTFRKAEKFFDVVGPFTGNGNSSHLISHNLGSTPAFMIMKRTDSTSGWMTAASDGAGNYKAAFNLNSTAQSYVTTPISTVSTDSTVDVGYWNPNWDGAANLSGATYVLYLFASDAGGFGDDGDESIIKCGSFTTDSSAVFYENLGFEPQWVLVKRSDGTSAWNLLDNMRGFLAEGTAGGKYLRPNTSGAEGNLSSTDSEYINATGFGANGNGVTGSANATFIYIAIRRPMKTPESGTEVFKANYVDNGASFPDMLSGFPVDMYFRRYVNTTNNPYWFTRLLGTNVLNSTTSGAEQSFSANSTAMDSNVGVMNIFSTNNTDFYGWMLKRATGCFDVVAYSGSGNFPQNVTHNLTVTPEMMILKYRDGSSNWYVYHSALGNTKICQLDNDTASSTSGSSWNNTSPTATQFTVGSLLNYPVAGKYIAYLFATLAGVSKVGSYTGTGSNVDVDCGFSAGARFILIKRTDSSGDWYLWDSLRGIVAGNDPYLLLNSTAAEVTNTDYIDPLNAGFTVTSSAPAALNASGGSYIFLAIS